MKASIFQIDAFADRVFAGNPALVCCLDSWLDDATLLAIAAEHGVAVTAFLVATGAEYAIRYFMPIGELALVGHASLAAAHVVLRILRPGAPSALLQRKSGPLVVSRADYDRLAISLPVVAPQPCAAPPALAAALGAMGEEAFATEGRYFMRFETEGEVAALSPNMDALMKLDCDSVVVTAPGMDCDFVSRAFAPKEGLPEDPVCGSAHLTLVPYWSTRLGRTRHRALQLSPRGGELHCALKGAEVELAGRCALYMEGTIQA